MDLLSTLLYRSCPDPLVPSSTASETRRLGDTWKVICGVESVQRELTREGFCKRKRNIFPTTGDEAMNFPDFPDLGNIHTEMNAFSVGNYLDYVLSCVEVMYFLFLYNFKDNVHFLFVVLFENWPFKQQLCWRYLIHENNSDNDNTDSTCKRSVKASCSYPLTAILT